MNLKNQDYDIICLSHLKWEHTLFQRPQQIMREFAREHKVLFVANCSFRKFVKALFKGKLKDYIGTYGTNLHYMTLPYLPLTGRFKFVQKLTNSITTLIARNKASRLRFQNMILWMYFPTFVENLATFRYKRLVYDCMDLFRGFKVSSPDVERLENKLLKSADIVFTGGRSLQKSKQGINPKTFCFPSGVEYEHFHKAALSETVIPEDIKQIKHPILGYFGAVDERIDYDLINHLCKERPSWNVVFLGPLVLMDKIPVCHPNFHYLGKKEYKQLPNYLKAFDVCLMPFIITELTLHISPTKTPEYLSGGKPVVSTPIPDVISDYSDVVKIAGNPRDFIDKVEQALNDKTDDLHLKIRQKAQTKSWRHIVQEMQRLIGEL
jgi:glycosyltransferase involved in cell wall biosynthesis